jgi:hypothetical protein
VPPSESSSPRLARPRPDNAQHVRRFCNVDLQSGEQLRNQVMMCPYLTEKAVDHRLALRSAHDQRLITHLGFQNRELIGQLCGRRQPKLLPGYQ